MYTVCPKCALTLVVTAADLRVAQGFVRCGRCSNVFNALARLSEDRGTGTSGVEKALSQPAAPPAQPEPVAAPDPPPPEPPAPEPLADPDSIPDTALEFDPEATDVTKLFIEQAPDPQWSAATGKFKALLRKVQPGAQQASPGQSALATKPGPATQQSSGMPPSSAAPQSGTARPTTPQTGAPAPRPTAQPPTRAQPPRAPTPPAAKTSQADTAPPPPVATIPTDQDSQFDIEMDAEFLATTAQFRPPLPQTPAQPAAHLPPQAAPPPKRPAVAHGAGPPASAAADNAPSPATPATPATPAAVKSASKAPAPDHRSAPPRKTPTRLPQSVRAALQDVGTAVERDDFSAGAAAIGAAAERAPLTRLWAIGSGALVVLLAAQIVHHYRHDLAANGFYRPLTALYSTLGVALVPRWNLEAYDVRQLGATADNTNAGQITVRASVKNTAKQAQPLPLLRVTLQDRYGNRIAARDVPPKAYLPSAIPAAAFLSAGQRVDAEMAFIDPGTNAVGFEIDACLPAPGGSIACQSDSGAR